MTQIPPDDRSFHSVDPDQLQQITVDDIEAGNLFPGLTLDDRVPMSTDEAEVRPGMTYQDRLMWEAAAILDVQIEGGAGSLIGFGE